MNVTKRKEKKRFMPKTLPFRVKRFKCIVLVDFKSLHHQKETSLTHKMKSSYQKRK